MPLLLTHMLQRELVEQPTEEDLRYVLSISVLAPASDPVDEVRSGLDFTHSTIAMCPSLCEHTTMPLPRRPQLQTCSHPRP